MANIRKEVLWFAEQMENKLKHHDDKGGWNDCEIYWLYERIKDELTELVQAIDLYKLGRGIAEDVIKEAADVSNFTMMIADIVNKKEVSKRKYVSFEEVLKALDKGGKATFHHHNGNKTSIRKEGSMDWTKVYCWRILTEGKWTIEE